MADLVQPGRYQLGGVVPLEVETVDADGLPARPDLAPVATVVGPGDLEAAVLRLAMVGGDDRRFGAAYRLALDLPLGSYIVTYTYAIAGSPGTATGGFELIPGGDPGGAVVALASVDRPLARYVVAQLASGRLVQGQNPRL